MKDVVWILLSRTPKPQPCIHRFHRSEMLPKHFQRPFVDLSHDLLHVPNGVQHRPRLLFLMLHSPVCLLVHRQFCVKRHNGNRPLLSSTNGAGVALCHGGRVPRLTYVTDSRSCGHIDAHAATFAGHQHHSLL